MPIPEEVKAEVVQMVDSGIYPSVALAAYDGGLAEFFVYGEADVDAGIDATEETIYEIGSITKTFTGLVLAQAFVDERLHLWAPLDDIFPESLGLRDPRGTPIELAHLGRSLMRPLVSQIICKNDNNYTNLHN